MNLAEAVPFILLAILCGALTYACYFDRAALWRMQLLGNRARGLVVSERTIEWEQTITFVGRLVALFTLFMILASISVLTEPSSDERLAPFFQPLMPPAASPTPSTRPTSGPPLTASHGAARASYRSGSGGGRTAHLDPEQGTAAVRCGRLGGSTPARHLCLGRRGAEPGAGADACLRG